MKSEKEEVKSEKTGVFANSYELEWIQSLWDDGGKLNWKLHQAVHKTAWESGLDEDFYYSMILRTGEFIRHDSMIEGKEHPAPHTAGRRILPKATGPKTDDFGGKV